MKHDAAIKSVVEDDISDNITRLFPSLVTDIMTSYLGANDLSLSHHSIIHTVSDSSISFAVSRQKLFHFVDGDDSNLHWLSIDDSSTGSFKLAPLLGPDVSPIPTPLILYASSSKIFIGYRREGVTSSYDPVEPGTGAIRILDHDGKDVGNITNLPQNFMPNYISSHDDGKTLCIVSSYMTSVNAILLYDCDKMSVLKYMVMPDNSRKFIDVAVYDGCRTLYLSDFSNNRIYTSDLDDFTAPKMRVLSKQCNKPSDIFLIDNFLVVPCYGDTVIRVFRALTGELVFEHFLPISPFRAAYYDGHLFVRGIQAKDKNIAVVNITLT